MLNCCWNYLRSSVPIDNQFAYFFLLSARIDFLKGLVHRSDIFGWNASRSQETKTFEVLIRAQESWCLGIGKKFIKLVDKKGREGTLFSDIFLFSREVNEIFREEFGEVWGIIFFLETILLLKRTRKVKDSFNHFKSLLLKNLEAITILLLIWRVYVDNGWKNEKAKSVQYLKSWWILFAICYLNKENAFWIL